MSIDDLDESNRIDFSVRLLQNLVVPTFVLDANGKVLIWNRACERLTGLPAGEVTGTADHWKAFYDKERPCLADVVLKEEHHELPALYVHHARPSLIAGGLTAENWCVMPCLTHRLYLIIDAGPVYDEQGELVAVVETLRDMTEYKNAQEALEELAVVDDLTGLANRRYFNDRIEKVWAHARREQEQVALILLDVDYFKLFNDTYGHQAGDDCLRAIAGVMQRSMQRSLDLAARYGGEEFCVLLPCTDAEGARLVAERIITSMERLMIPHRESHVSDYVTTSAGVAAISLQRHGNETPAALIARADEALYDAKSRGRNQIVVHE